MDNIKFVSIASGSSGNSILVSYKNTNFLIDCGISTKRINNCLSKFGLSLNDISALFITHSHIDHIAYLKDIIKYDNIKIVSTREILSEVIQKFRDKKIFLDEKNFNVIFANMKFKYKDIIIEPFNSYHDVNCVFYKFYLNKNLIFAILTDCGYIDEYIEKALSNVNYLMLECNYDYNMLIDSKRPIFLKQRILGSEGHLSNIDCAECIMKINSNNLKKVALSHISKDCNSETKAVDFVNEYLNKYYDSTITLPMIFSCSRDLPTIIYNS